MIRSWLARFLPLLLLLGAVSAQAQVRPSGTFFLGLRGGATAYGGEFDGTGDAYDGDVDSDHGWLIDDLGWSAGGELGYQFTRGLGFAAGFVYGRYPNLDREDAFNPNTGQSGQLNEGESVPQVIGFFRLNGPWRLTPFVDLGGTVTFGQGQQQDGDFVTGYGPLVGGGLDLLVGRQVSLSAGVAAAFVFPDDAVDGFDPDGQGFNFADEADYDNLVQYNLGLRYFFQPGTIDVDATIDCTMELTVGESGAFTAYVNDDASDPLDYVWNWGDGATSPGLTASHAYSAPGTYTVSFTATGPANADTETCLVTVIEEQFPPALASCRVSPSRVDVGGEVTVSASVSGSEPFDVSVDFGDGATADALPASHAYDATGVYTVTVTATNAYGSDTCTVTVTVGDSFCDEVTELNTVYFDYEMSSLTDEARSRLDENLEVLRRCPDICVVINAYADDQEGNARAISERRAQAVRDYYVANGISPDRILARGLGEAPDSNSKEDPSPGDRNARRAESIPTDCDQMGYFRAQPPRLDRGTHTPPPYSADARTLPDALQGPGDVVPAQGGVTWIVASTEGAGAEQLAAQYRRDGYRASVLPARVAGRTVYRVAVGQFATVAEARRMRAALPASAPPDTWVLRLN